MKEIILKNIEKALLRIALSLEKKNTTQLNFQIDEKSSVFIWDPDEYEWQKNYEDLKDFYTKEGHSSISSSSGPLGRWVNHLRKIYKKNKLPREKIDLLNEIESVWDPLEEQWQESYDQLKKCLALLIKISDFAKN